MKHTHLALFFLILLLTLSGCAGKSNQQPRLQNMGNGICQDTFSGKMWQIEKSKMTSSLAEAEQYARTLKLGGYSDWRLPSTNELFDLTYAFDLFQNGDCTLDRQGNYWSKENDGKGKAGAWEITADQCDPAREYVSGAKGFVRAVRP